MKRREFITLVGGAAAAWPLTARAQQPDRIPKVGFIGGTNAAVWAPWAAAFVGRLREFGWVDGRTISIEYRWSDNRSERIAEIAAEFLRLKVDVIVTAGERVATLKQATAKIPIVFAIASDPVGSGLVASLSRPGGNVTGLSLQANDLAGKRIGLLREALPRLRRIAILGNASYPAAMLEMGQVESATRTLGFEAVRLKIQNADDIAPAIEGIKGSADALYVCIDALVSANLVQIGNLALVARLPTVHSEKSFVESGGLMSYGPDIPDMFRRSAELVDKILKGEKAADIPVEQPTKFELVINLKTAKALALVVPHDLLVLADEVIE